MDCVGCLHFGVTACVPARSKTVCVLCVCAWIHPMETELILAEGKVSCA